MRKILTLIIVASLLISCSGPKEKSGSNLDSDNSEVSTTNNPDTINPEHLEGAWGSNELDNAIFGVYGDSIYYPDPDLWYTWKIEGDTLIQTDEEGRVEKSRIIKLNWDTLIIYYENFGYRDTLLKR